MSEIKDVVERYAYLWRKMLSTLKTDGVAYHAAEDQLRELMQEIWQREDKEIIEQAIYYQNIIIECERHMPLPMEQDTRTAGSYTIHRCTQEEYQNAKNNLERLLQLCKCLTMNE